MAERKVVITGMGMVNSLGFDVETIWDLMLKGVSGIKTITSIDMTGHKCTNGSQIDSEQLAAILKERNVRALERSTDIAQLASGDALLQSGLLKPDTDPEPLEAACLFGCGAGATHTLYTSYMAYAERGLSSVRPTTVPRCMANALSSNISLRYRLTGPNYVIVSACASSTVAVGTAFRMIRNGDIDMALCGGSEACFDPATYAGWNNLGVMSKNPDPSKACRPFDIDRDGFVLGEGSGAIVLESLESATARGADIIAELAGYGDSSDATHMTAPNPDGQVKAIKAAMRSAGLAPNDIGYINAHGTATRANDAAECKSIKLALGSSVDSVVVSSSKPFFGHQLGSAGITELITTVLAVSRGRIPPNLNLDNPDPECDVNLAGPEPCELHSLAAIKNSFGFGGNNAVVAVKRV